MGWTGCVSGALVATFLALFLMAVGFSIPFWTSYEQKDPNDITKTEFSVYVGTWYLMVCKSGESNSCASEAIEPNFDQGYDNITFDFRDSTQEKSAKLGAAALAQFTYWWAIQLVTTIALGLVLLAALILLCCRCAGIHSKGFFVVSGILLFFGGLCALAISILLAVALGEKFNIPNYEVNGETFPWSALVFGVGGILAMIAGILISIIVAKWKRYGAYFQSDDEDEKYLNDNQQQMSNLSKSYDRPRHPYNGSRSDWYGGNAGYEGRGREFSQSKKYREHDYNYRDDRNYNNRAYDQSYDYDRNYDRRHDRGYDSRTYHSQSRSGDNMYRPYNQYRY